MNRYLILSFKGSLRQVPMFRDAIGFEKIYIACGYTDLRNGIDGLANLIQNQFHLDPFDKGVLFLFCGKRPDRIRNGGQIHPRLLQRRPDGYPDAGNGRL